MRFAVRWAAIRVNMYRVSGASSSSFKTLTDKLELGWRDSAPGDLPNPVSGYRYGLLGPYRYSHPLGALLGTRTDAIGLALKRGGLISFASIIQKHWTKKMLVLTSAEERADVSSISYGLACRPFDKGIS